MTADEPFDPIAYWRDMGPWLAGPGAATPEHEATEAILRRVFRSLEGVHSVLDVGCGRGRLASVLAQELPEAKYTGIDVGMAQLEATGWVQPHGELYLSSLQEFDPPGGLRYDLVLASEVLLHIPPDEIGKAVERLELLSRRYIVTVDWTEPLPDSVEMAYWNWRHDYEELFDATILEAIRSDLQTVYVLAIQ